MFTGVKLHCLCVLISAPHLLHPHPSVCFSGLCVYILFSLHRFSNLCFFSVSGEPSIVNPPSSESLVMECREEVHFLMEKGGLSTHSILLVASKKN